MFVRIGAYLAQLVEDDAEGEEEGEGEDLEATDATLSPGNPAVLAAQGLL